MTLREAVSHRNRCRWDCGLGDGRAQKSTRSRHHRCLLEPGHVGDHEYIASCGLSNPCFVPPPSQRSSEVLLGVSS
jgi:hypothetical protein